MSLQDNNSSEVEDSDTCSTATFGQKSAPPKQCHEPLLEEMEERISTRIAKFHCNVTQPSLNRVVSIGDVVIVHDEDQPRGKWCTGKVEALVTGSDGHVRGAIVPVKHEGALYKEVFPGKTLAHLSLTVDVRGSNSKWRAI